MDSRTNIVKGNGYDEAHQTNLKFTQLGYEQFDLSNEFFLVLGAVQ